jgi:mRNA interferase RelE/StbE
MSFVVLWPEDVRKQLSKMERKIADRIVSKVESIRNNPFLFVAKIKDSDFYRLRVGDYRVIMSIDRGKMVILVIEIGHRRNIYKKH